MIPRMARSSLVDGPTHRRLYALDDLGNAVRDLGDATGVSIHEIYPAVGRNGRCRQESASAAGAVVCGNALAL